jgi:hypothetical protein
MKKSPTALLRVNMFKDHHQEVVTYAVRVEPSNQYVSLLFLADDVHVGVKLTKFEAAKLAKLVVDAITKEGKK